MILSLGCLDVDIWILNKCRCILENIIKILQENVPGNEANHNRTCLDTFWVCVDIFGFDKELKESQCLSVWHSLYTFYFIWFEVSQHVVSKLSTLSVNYQSFS